MTLTALVFPLPERHLPKPFVRGCLHSKDETPWLTPTQTFTDRADCLAQRNLVDTLLQTLWVVNKNIRYDLMGVRPRVDAAWDGYLLARPEIATPFYEAQSRALGPSIADLAPDTVVFVFGRALRSGHDLLALQRGFPACTLTTPRFVPITRIPFG